MKIDTGKMREMLLSLPHTDITWEGRMLSQYIDAIDAAYMAARSKLEFLREEEYLQSKGEEK